MFFDANSSSGLEEALHNYQDQKAFYDDSSLKNKQFVSEKYNREEMFTRFLKQL